MATTYAGLGDSQAKPGSESKLADANASLGSLRLTVACLIKFRKS